MIGNEKWLVLVVALLMITVLVLLSSMAINTTTTDIKIANNYREGSRRSMMPRPGSIMRSVSSRVLP
jgi:hypothetical protein